jgi:Ulp1 family protease
MKIKEIISESQRDEIRRELSPQNGFNLTQSDDDFDEYDITDLGNDEQEMNLSSNADQKMINAVKKVCDMYKGQGHAQVELLPFITKVIEIAKKPVNLADLIAINKKSPEIQSMVDSIDEKKVKFKNMSVKNEDPNKAAEKKDATVGGMAGRAASRNRGI